jgi:hypothetical protein
LFDALHSSTSQIEDLLNQLERIIWTLNRMANGSWIRIDFIIIPSNVCLISEEVDSSVCDAAGFLGFGLQMPQAVGLVPARWEDIE